MPSTPSSRNTYFVVRFVNNAPVWERFDGQSLQPAQQPRSTRSMPVLAMLPDRLFFFVQPDMTQHAGSHRQMAAAARLRMEQMFPNAALSENSSGILFSKDREQLLGYVHHPALAEFTHRHQDVLRRANAVTTPFFMAWNAAREQGQRTWIWENPEDGIAAIVTETNLDFFPGDSQELRTRLSAQSVDGTAAPQIADAPKRWQLPDLIAAAPAIGWSQLRLPLPTTNGNGSGLRRLSRILLAVVLLGVLFCLGQGLRLATHQQQTVQWEQATTHLYGLVLSLPLGEDPYGRLLFRLSQLQGPDQSGPDILGMLGLLSAAAPPDFRVENFSMGPNTGTVRARLNDYGQLETLLKALEDQDQLRFELDQATSAENAILATLRVTY